MSLIPASFVAKYVARYTPGLTAQHRESRRRFRLRRAFMATTGRGEWCWSRATSEWLRNLWAPLKAIDVGNELSRRQRRCRGGALAKIVVEGPLSSASAPGRSQTHCSRLDKRGSPLATAIRAK
ncbi:hypothetical protein PsYK624_060890 [Phanerochaete sordida]|uniref:Uncharacterized protein n=1 Tax=Phanerochaete sordida TaxID=48140 RepID=A0A9P3G838_9APHY|nr:hypothetical protein PsYK624_060890 [Phanerochaete sordida]